MLSSKKQATQNKLYSDYMWYRNRLDAAKANEKIGKYLYRNKSDHYAEIHYLMERCETIGKKLKELTNVK